MKNTSRSSALISTTLMVALVSVGMSNSALAQVAGSNTPTGFSVTQLSEVALGWSVRQTLLGKAVYNEAGAKVGNIQDLIITPDKIVSYAIIEAGGFVGLGAHNVAIPLTQIQNQDGKLVLPGATRELLKNLPAFSYASDTATRDQFIKAADRDIAMAREKLAEMQGRTAAATSEAKAKMNVEIVDVQADLNAAEAKLGELKNAGANRWRLFEAAVRAATDRLRRSLEKVTA